MEYVLAVALIVFVICRGLVCCCSVKCCYFDRCCLARWIMHVKGMCLQQQPQ